MEKVQVMVVEDEGIVALTIEKKLESLGYKAAGVVATGEKAIDQAGKIRPDLVLMDIRLAGEMDGVEAAAQIRDRFDIPVVYLTAHTDEKTLQRAKITEPFGYLTKPFEIGELYATIEIALYKHQLEKKLKERTIELQEALAQIKTLKGMIPICASCKNIRDDQGYWQKIEAYIEENSEAELSHGICPDCKKKLYPEYYGEGNYSA